MSIQSVRNVFGVIVALVVLAVCGRANAQSAPEGNAHPQQQMVSESTQELVNPFGEHNRDPAKNSTVAQKADFASKLNLDPLRSLAVFHNGRLKVLDTLARDTVQKITGRSKYVDFIHAEKSSSDFKGDGVRDVKFDPMFTLLDLTIDPAYYVERPLIGVRYLPLRREMLEMEFAQQEEVQTRWMKLTRVTPMMVQKSLGPIADKHQSEPAFISALGQVDEATRLFINTKSNLVMVASERSDLPWKHLSELPENAPVRVAAAALGEAWRNRDAAKVNEAAATLAAELPKINSAMYPTSRRSVEMAYNKLNAFEWGFWLYFLSLVSLLLGFGTGRKWLASTGTVLLIGAVLLHAAGFVLRCVVAERFSIQNQFESMTGLSLFACVVAVVIMIARKQLLFGAAAAAVGFLVLVTATQTGIPGQSIEREAAILNTSVLLKYHVTTVLVSYGLISLGMVCSVFYLLSHYLGRRETAVRADTGTGAVLLGGALGAGEDEVAKAPRAKLLGDLDTAQMIVLQLAFWTLGVGILLGAWWADHSWGRWWAFDPKETWALITWIVYLIVIHVRMASPGKKGLTTAWLSVIGFIVMLWTYFGVNLLLPGLHAYA